MTLTGGCVCGGVRFEVTAPLRDAGWCHCTRCQRRTGVFGSISGGAEPGTFHIIEGRELVTEYEPPGGYIKAFCSVCGGHLYSREPGGFENVGVRFGAIDGDPGVRAQYHQHTASAASWHELPDDGLPRFPGPRE
jgi:hypothetical protein